MTRPLAVSTTRVHLPTVSPSLGVLSVHLDGAPCRVGCEFCYLGAREGGGAGALDVRLACEVIARVACEEVAVAVSEPGGGAVAPLAAIVRAASARKIPVAVTTTAAVLAAHPELLHGVARVNLSIDPRKGSVSPRLVGLQARAARDGGGREVALIVSLVTPEFAKRLVDGLLAEYLALDDVDRVALNALKPPPPWCGRAFWLATCARIAPLLERHLERKLFLDCWVAARIFGLGGCPARPDLSPGPVFRSCVYQPSPDFGFASADQLATRLHDFVAPERCPFPID